MLYASECVCNPGANFEKHNVHGTQRLNTELFMHNCITSVGRETTCRVDNTPLFYHPCRATVRAMVARAAAVMTRRGP